MTEATEHAHKLRDIYWDALKIKVLDSPEQTENGISFLVYIFYDNKHTIFFVLFLHFAPSSPISPILLPISGSHQSVPNTSELQFV